MLQGKYRGDDEGEGGIAEGWFGREVVLRTGQRLGGGV